MIVLQDEELEDMRLDGRGKMPSGMEDYLSTYGWHFSKKLCDWACKRMQPKTGKMTPYTKDEVLSLLQRSGVTLTNDVGYDSVYVANMAKADYMGSSLANEQYLAKFIKDYLDDPDGYEEVAMTRFYADMIGKGIPIMWEDML